MTATARQRNSSCRSFPWESRPFRNDSLPPATARVARASASGTRSTTAMSSSISAVSIRISLPMNSSRYTGRSTTWSTRFSGSMDIPSSTFPLLMPVNTRYQSVQGVTSSMISPMRRSGLPPKKARPRAYASTGVSTKFRARAEAVKRTFLRESPSLLRSTERNRTYRRAIRKTSTMYDAPDPMPRAEPAATPIAAEAMIRTGWYLPMSMSNPPVSHRPSQRPPYIRITSSMNEWSNSTSLRGSMASMKDAANSG